jgi:hypothetical protein
MSNQYLNQILPLLDEGSVIQIHSEEFGILEATVVNTAVNSIGVIVSETEEEAQHYAEFYDDDDEFTYKLVA